MFESSLLPSRRGKDARLVRGIAIGSIVLQAAAVATFVVVPLLYPDKLPALTHATRLTQLELRRPPVKVVPPKPQLVHLTSQAALSAPTHSAPAVLEARRGGMITHASQATLEEPLLAVGNGNQMGGPLNLAAGFGAPTGSGDSPHITVKPATPAAPIGPLRVSQGVSKGLLLAPMRPIYPPIAVAAKVEGTVTVTATIDRTGRIVNVQVLDGPPMLREAAATAVRDARYHPYLLNGEPTEVLTTISVTFHLSA